MLLGRLLAKASITSPRFKHRSSSFLFEPKTKEITQFEALMCQLRNAWIELIDRFGSRANVCTEGTLHSQQALNNAEAT